MKFEDISLGVMEDPSILAPWDMWGIGVDASRCLISNPAYGRGHKQFVESLGFDLSENVKTVYCFSQWFDSCRPSAWCMKNCYGTGVRFRCGGTPDFLQRNYTLMEAIGDGQVSDHVILDLAQAIINACKSKGLDNLRWMGVGDWTDGTRILAEAIVSTDSEFTVWGFTRKPQELLKAPVRPNLVIWCSTDYTMRARLDDAVEAALKHGTGLGYSSDVGQSVSASNASRRVLKKDVTDRDRDSDTKFRELLQLTEEEFKVPWRVSHGFHGASSSGKTIRAGQQIQTHLGLPNECPGTDPFSTAPSAGVCNVCRWCLQKKRPHRTLQAHRKALGWG